MSPTITPTSGIAGGIGGILGGLAGGFGTPANGTQTSTGNSATQTNSSGSTNSSSQLSDLINLLSNISGTTSGTTSGTGTSTSTPNLSAGSQNFINSLQQAYSGLANPNLQGYTDQQIQQTNQNSNAQQQAVDQLMASRGLSTSPASGTAAANIQGQRIGTIGNLEAQQPILQNQMQLSNLAAGSNFAGLLPGLSGSTTSQNTGSTSGTTNNQTTSSQQNQQQNQQNWQNVFNYLNSQSNQNNTTNTTSNSGGGVGGAISGVLGGLLGGLKAFSDERLKEDIHPIENATDTLHKLQADSWAWKGTKGKVKSSGFIAQELQKVIPEAVHEVQVNGKSIKTIDYTSVLPYIIKSIQEVDNRSRRVGR